LLYYLYIFFSALLKIKWISKFHGYLYLIRDWNSII
jgi:hypothetical protein